MNIKYVGLKPEEALLKIQSDAVQAIREKVEAYRNNVDKLLAAYEPPEVDSFWGAMAIAPATLYSLIKSGLDSLVDFGASFAYVIENAINDAMHIFDSSDGTDWRTDTKYFFGNLGLSLHEAISTSLVSTGANLGRVIGIDPKWAYGEQGLIPKMARQYNLSRSQLLASPDKISIFKPYQPVEDLMSSQWEEYRKYLDFAEGRTPEQIIEDRYYEDIRNAIVQTGEFQNWVSRNFVEPIANTLTLGTKKYADRYYKDSEFYNFLMGAAESAGRILASWAVAKIGAKAGVNPQTLSSAYFAASIFADSFEEALKNGATMQDAYTYAVGTAFLETAIENFGGRTTSGVKKAAKRSLFEKVLGEKWGNIVQQAVEEGLEEIGSEVAGTGLSYYGSGERQVDSAESFREFANRIMFSFLSGSITSMGLGIGHDMYIDTTAIGKSRRVLTDISKQVTSENSNKVYSRFQKDLENFVAYINRPDAKGLKTTTKIVAPSGDVIGPADVGDVKKKEVSQYVGVLTPEEKSRYIRQIGLANVIEEVDGKFQIREKAREMGDKIFAVRVGDNVVNRADYAINDAVWGVDISDDGTTEVVKMANLNERGKKILDIAQKRNIPIAIIDEAPRGKNDLGISGFYSADNGIIYINQNPNVDMTDEEIESVIIKHELVHHIASKNPELFEKLKKMVNKFVDFEVDGEGKKIDVTYKNKKVGEILEKKGFSDHVLKSFLDYFEGLKDMNFAVKQAQEEVVAYFVEDMLEGGDFLEIISKKDEKLFEELKNETTDAIDMAVGEDKKLARKLKKIRKKFETIAEKTLAQKRTLQSYIDHFLGSGYVLEDMFNKELLEKYDAEYLWDMLWETYEKDPQAREIKIDGKVYPLSQVLARTANVKPKRLARPDWDRIYSEFKYDAQEKTLYLKLLRKFINENKYVQDEEIREIVGDAEWAVDKIRDGGELRESEYEILRQLVTDYKFSEAEKKWREENEKVLETTKFRVLKNLIARVVRFMNDPQKSGITGWRNRSHIMRYNAAYLALDKSARKEGESVEAFAKRIQMITSLSLEPYFPEQFNVTYYIPDKADYIEFLIKPTREFLEEETRKAEEAEIKKQETTEVEGLMPAKPPVKTTKEDSINALEEIGVTLEGKKVITLDDNITLEKLEEIKYDDNNIVVGNPPFAENKNAEYLKKALEIAPVVAIVLPRPWAKSYMLQKEIPGDKKLIYNELIPLKSLKTSSGNRQMKTVVQIWVDSKNKEFEDFENIRAFFQPKMAHPDFSTFTLTGERRKYEDAKYFNFDLAVVRESNTAKFSEIITKYEDLKPKGHYLLIKANNPEALQIFSMIDFEALADKGSTIQRGFTTYDLIEEYERIKKEVKSIKTPMKRLADDTKLTDKERKYLGEIAEYFTKDKSGKFVIKSEYIVRQKPAKQAVKINGVVYSSDEYAVHTTVDLSSVNAELKLKRSEFERPLKLSELSEKEQVWFDFFRASNMNFVLYRAPQNASILGFEYPSEESYVVYINTEYLYHNFDNFHKFLTGTFVHEHVHELNKRNKARAFKFAAELANILFEVKDGEIVQSDIFKKIEETRYKDFGSFLRYMKNSYWYLNSGNSFSSYKDLYNALIKGDNGDRLHYRVVDEVVAQICGVLFSDYEVYKTVFQGKAENILPFHQLYTKILDDPNIPIMVKEQIRKAVFALEDAYKEFLADLKKKFPPEAIYKLRDLNKFIRSFTNNRFRSRNDLIQRYLEERANHKHGLAHMAVDNIIYIASLFAEQTQKGYEFYQNMKEEFEGFRKNIEFLLNSEDDLTVLQKGEIRQLVNLLIKQNISEEGFILSEGGLDLVDRILEFAEEYEMIPEELLKIFGLPTHKEIISVAAELQRNQAEGNATAFQVNFREFKSLLKKIKQVLTSETDDIFRKIADLKIAYREKEMDLFITKLKNHYAASKKKITSVKLQSESPFKETLAEVMTLIAGGRINGVDIPGIIQVVQNNKYNLKQLRAEIVPLLEKIRELARKSPDIPEDVFEEYIEPRFKTIYRHLALLLKDPSVLYEVYPPVKKEGGPQSIDEVFGTVITLERLGGKFNANAFARALMEILERFQTRYTTSLSGDTLTHDEYAAKTSKQVIQFKDKLANVNARAVSWLMPYQFFFGMYKDLVGNEIEFFSDFYREYIASVMRRSDILAEYKESYKEWVKSHKKHQKFTLEKTEVAKNMLLQIRKDVLLNLAGEARREYEEDRQKYEEAKEAYNEIKDQLAAKNAQIKNTKEALKGHEEKSFTWTALKKLLEQYEEEKKALVEEKNERKIIRDNLKILLENETIEKRTKSKIFEWAAENKAKNSEVSWGQIITTYLAVEREIEMETAEYEDVPGINPTKHFEFGNVLHFFDNELLWKKGYAVAKDNAIPFVIFADNKEKLRDYLWGLIKDNEIAQEIINFAKERFDKNYEYIDEIFFAKYGVHLPRQETYVPFASLESDYARDVELKIINRRNMATPDGFVMETTLGARTDLRIENIFAVIENHTRSIANYCGFNRLLYDWQNLYVNKAGGAPLQEAFTGKDNKFGQNNDIAHMIEQAFADNLGYGDVMATPVEKWANKVLLNSMAATMSVNIPSMVKQFASVLTVMIKHKLSPSAFIKNVVLSLGRSKYRNWLLKNNSNFYHRADAGNVPHLADAANLGIYYIAQDVTRKIANTLTKHIGWADNTVLVAAFKTIADEVRKQNPGMPEEEVLKKANEQFMEVLLFGVANTDPGFRAHFSNSNKFPTRFASRFQSENIIHAAALYRDYVYVRNGYSGGWKRFARDFIAFLLSALFTAYVSNTFNRMRGYYEDKEEADFDFWVNELLLNNIIGGLPVVNQFTSLIQFEKPKDGGGKLISAGFSPRLPGITEVYEIIKAVDSMQTGKNIPRKILRIFENIGSMVGFPVKNINRLISTTSRLLGAQGIEQAESIARFYSSQTKAQAFTAAIKENNRTKINMYVEEVYGDLEVRNEIVNLLAANPDLRLNLYNVKYFSKDKVKYAIPEDVREKYNDLAQRALRILIRKGAYKRMKAEDKVKAMQRIINYHYNYMKSVVLKEKRELLSPAEVVERALKIEG